ncbi:MAG TPA: hypothetical protein VNO70_17780 [Blastocatellia bacterium]|nr:hypothetical protein [Blastocatellia bacterium]
MMRRFNILVVGLAVAAALAVCVRGDNPGADASRAEEILNQARAALGGAEKLSAISSLSVAGSFRRVAEFRGPSGEVETRDQVGEVELDFLMPDKYLRTETLELMGGAGVTILRALNGEQTWSDSRSSGGNIMIRVGPGPGTASPAAGLRAEFNRHLLVFLLTAPASSSLEFTYAGEAEAEDGRAHVLDVKGKDGFAARLFLDKQTHLPLMLSYRAARPRAQLVMAQGGRMSGSREEIERRVREQAQQNPPEMAEMEVQERFSDYRKVDGILLPHRIEKATDGKANEEWEIKKYKLNPIFKPQHFEKK